VATHFPRSDAELLAWFRTDEDCLDYLEWVRWPGGFICPSCGHAGGWRLGDRRYECAGCNGRISVTAGTIFDRTRTPLTVWFTACWLFATRKDGISALSLQQSLQIGSYQTSWAMLHRLRSVLARPGGPLLAGTVEAGHAVIGDVPAGIAVEVLNQAVLGRCQIGVLAGGSLSSFISGAVEPGTRLVTGPGEPLAAVHRVAAAATRWLLRTHQGSVKSAHLHAYLNEFAFRFNGRRLASRGLAFYQVLELAAAHDPVRLRDLLARQQPPTTPTARPVAGPGLERGREQGQEQGLGQEQGQGLRQEAGQPEAGRPWRA
jgi:Transposase zinc-ribbon domain